MKGGGVCVCSGIIIGGNEVVAAVEYRRKMKVALNHLIITMIKWIRTSRLSMRNSLSVALNLYTLILPPFIISKHTHTTPHTPHTLTVHNT